MINLGFKLYLIFLLSFFLHLPARLPILGAIHFDLLLVAVISVLIVLGRDADAPPSRDVGGTSKYLLILIAFMIVTLPFVAWPGSVLRTGAEGFAKAVIFYYFTISLASSEKNLKTIVYVLLFCQVFRVLEPLYMNITDGYWGDVTHLGGGEFADRLSGAPHDIINPNELGYVIIISFILLYYLFVRRGTFIYRIIAISIMASFIYALVLTASRSAFLVMGATILMIIWKSKHRYMLLLLSGIGIFIAANNLSDFHKDRYFSLFSSETKGAVTAKGRIDSLLVDFEVTLDRPLIGHGLGTSEEANYNVKGKGQISHNLYLEVATELGYVGLIIYLLFMRSIIKNIIMSKNYIQKHSKDDNDFSGSLTMALYVMAVSTFIFSFAQYGLSIYAIYFIAGLAVVLQRGALQEETIRLAETDGKVV